MKLLNNTFKNWYNCLRGKKISEGKLLHIFLENEEKDNHIFEVKAKKAISKTSFIIEEDFKNYYIKGLNLPNINSGQPLNVHISLASGICPFGKCTKDKPYISLGLQISIYTNDVPSESFKIVRDLKYKTLPYWYFPK